MRFSCPQCKHQFEVSKDGITHCPECGHSVDIANYLTVSIDPDSTAAQLESKTPDSLEPGDEVAHFMLLKVLGAGGFGTVFEAFDRRLNRNVALKVPHFALANPKEVRVFIHEARAAAKIDHPNIVSVFEIGRNESTVFIVSQLIRGRTLRQLIKEKKLTESESTRLIRIIAEAMGCAHDSGIAHRDLKPGNILIDEAGNPHVTDFGLAKLLKNQDKSLAKSGMLVGTPAYMSPEQAKGMAKKADRRTDIYSIGTIYYELLSGKKPYENSSTTILEDIVSGKAAPIRKVAPQISYDAAAICQKAMAVAPVDRYQTTDELIADLDALEQGFPVKARPVGGTGQLQYFASRHRTFLALATPVIALLVWLAFQFVFSDPRSPEITGPNGENEVANLQIRIPSDPRVENFEVYGINDEAMLLSKDSLEVVKIEDGLFEFRAAPGFYLLKGKRKNEIREFVRIVPDTESNTGLVNVDSLVTKWTKEDGIINLERFDWVDPEDPNFQLNKMALIQGGTFEGGSEQRRMDGKRAPHRFDPRKLHAISAFSVSVTEVSAQQFFEVMGRYPVGMPKVPATGPPANQPVTGVTWLEAVEYCERTGSRLPQFLELQYLATNKGTTRFPSPAAETTAPWPAPTIGSPVNEINSDGIRNLYSSVGEWTWDINLFGELNINGMPSSHDWRNMRIIFGIPASFEKANVMREGNEDTRNFHDRPFYFFHSRVGFRIVRPLHR